MSNASGIIRNGKEVGNPGFGQYQPNTGCEEVGPLIGFGETIDDSQSLADADLRSTLSIRRVLNISDALIISGIVGAVTLPAESLAGFVVLTTGLAAKAVRGNLALEAREIRLQQMKLSGAQTTPSADKGMDFTDEEFQAAIGRDTFREEKAGVLGRLAFWHS